MGARSRWHRGQRARRRVGECKCSTSCKAIAQLRRVRRSHSTIAHAKRSIKERLLASWQRHCRKGKAIMRDRRMFYGAVAEPLRPPASLSQSRRILGRFNQARMGHGDSASYHRRFDRDHATTAAPPPTACTLSTVTPSSPTTTYCATNATTYSWYSKRSSQYPAERLSRFRCGHGRVCPPSAS